MRSLQVQCLKVPDTIKTCCFLVGVIVYVAGVCLRCKVVGEMTGRLGSSVVECSHC